MQGHFEHYLTDVEVAEMLGIGVQTLRNNRSLGRGIPYIKVPGSRLVRYLREDVQRFMNAGRIVPEGEK